MAETEIYEFIAKYRDHIIRNNNIPEDLICRVCKYILIDPHQAPCGCEFCKSCICDYLKGEDKSCPGSGEQCSTRLISFSNVESIGSTNVKIKQFNIKCINEGCEESCSIKDMMEHIKSCGYQLENCPFFKIGCKYNQMLRVTLDDHLSTQILYHSNLIMTSMTFTQQENESIQNQLLANINILNELQNNETNMNTTIENNNLSNKKKMVDLENLVCDLNSENERMEDKLQCQAQDLEKLEAKVNEMSIEIKKLKNEKKGMQNEIKTFTKNLYKPSYQPQSSIPFPEELNMINHDLQSNEQTITQDSILPDTSTWTCNQCTFKNSDYRNVCSVCLMRRF